MFGGFISQNINLKGDFFGTGESFLFALGKANEFTVYKATNKNNFFCIADQTGIGMGSGDFYGLFIEENLKKGSTHPCRTYDNDLLDGKTHFAIKKLEIWGFQ